VRRLFSTRRATPATSTLSLHDALPICDEEERESGASGPGERVDGGGHAHNRPAAAARVGLAMRADHVARPQGSKIRQGVVPCARSEEHTSEIQSLTNLVCRPLPENKKP